MPPTSSTPPESEGTASGDGTTATAADATGRGAAAETERAETERAETERAEPTEELCAVVRAVDTIGSEWRLVVLYALSETDEKRFNELKRATEASSRTLSRVLDDLGEAGLVERRVEDSPIATYYSLTARGAALCPVFDELERWGDEHL